MYASRFLFNKRGVLPPRDKIAHFQRFIYLIDLDCYKPCKGEIYTAMGIAHRIYLFFIGARGFTTSRMDFALSALCLSYWFRLLQALQGRNLHCDGHRPSHISVFYWSEGFHRLANRLRTFSALFILL